MNEQLEFLKQIVTRLDSAGIPYMITGSMALAIYTKPRMTRDIDLVVDCRPSDSQRLAELFRVDCYVDEASIRDAVAAESVFNIIHREWISKADFIVRKNETYRKVEFERRRLVNIEGVSISVVAPEDLILSKLCWARDSESELQTRDVCQLIESIENLDWPYLEKWAERLGVKELLDRVKGQ